MRISVFYHHMIEAAKQEKCSLDEIFCKIKEVGITAVELDRDGIDEEDKLKEMLDRYGFCVSSIYGFYDFPQGDEEEKCRRHIHLAKVLGADKIMIIPGFYHSEEEAGKEKELLKMIERTGYLCSLAQENGIIGTIEDFDSEVSPLSSVNGMKQFLTKIPSLSVTLDTGNFIISGEDEVMAYEALKDRIIHVHCKDRAYNENKKLCPSPVGKGFIKMGKVIQNLKKSNYHGFLTIEHFDTENYFDFIMKSAKWIREEGWI